jgi:eukaryotic-like serine/threonine-protein kinase
MLGRALLYQKKYDEANAALKEALAIQEKTFGPAHPEVADTVNELGNVASIRGNYEEAEKRFQREGDIYRSVYGDRHYLVAIALSNVAYAHMNMKARRATVPRCGPPLHGDTFGRQRKHWNRAD